jgi:hypothetical protein
MRPLTAVGVVLTAVTLAAASGSATAATPAQCPGSTATTASAQARDCTIRGMVDGHHIGPGGPTAPITWRGELVLRQQFVDPFTGFPPSQPTFVIAAGSSITWEIAGSSGDCTYSGSGKLGPADLTGNLTVTGPHQREWTYALDVGPRTSQSSADRVMPYTVSCPSGSGVSDASPTEGLLFGYNGYAPGQSPLNTVTDGLKFTGRISAPVTGVWDWNLSGEVFPQDVSEHGIAFIKAREGLRLRAYEDQLNLCTIGYGHLILPEGRCGKRARMHWTAAQAERELRSDLDKLIEPYVRKASIRLGMNQCQYDALTSLPTTWLTARAASLRAGSA